MIWNKNLLYQISDVRYHITKLYLVNNEKNDKITNGAPYVNWHLKQTYFPLPITYVYASC